MHLRLKVIDISYSEQQVYLLNKGFYNVNKYQNKENGTPTIDDQGEVLRFLTIVFKYQDFFHSNAEAIYLSSGNDLKCINK